ncbi:phosphoribosyl-ATP diphosphatase [Ectobacillus antri]|jgi:phosphoribosyl-ATP pyrophosphohydrolase|uniref:Phosphoribosyl-ATP pyrophosphatase n=1 Tax=Ectobacillus antri TaxID=2486280 RepID=A0ABT6H4C0_9BACI|nr:phosphoribosyl-ATP diphosphatase [Ectobacillus antri]MDG4656874.1 phosphoribosyl-ATP diphosphatase [Ectobacillus antri]MDG5754229.1 phosphoribosyl-ATP diphosphatase [Ectobacillus antri]
MSILRELYEDIQNRKKNPQDGSYTNYLFTKGEDKILKKIGEECTEVVIASKRDNHTELVSELMDLTYHCLVLMAEKDVSLEELEEEAKRRRGKLSKVGDRKEIDTL